MVSFIDIYFHFLANFQTETLPHMFSIFTHVMKPIRDTNSEPGLPVAKTVDEDPAGCQCWRKEIESAKILRTKNRKSKDYCTADKKMYCFLRTIFWLAIPARLGFKVIPHFMTASSLFYSL